MVTMNFTQAEADVLDFVCRDHISVLKELCMQPLNREQAHHLRVLTTFVKKLENASNG